MSAPERKPSDEGSEAPSDTKCASESALIQPPVEEPLVSAGAEKTYSGLQAEASKEEKVSRTSPRQEQQHQAGNDVRGSNLLASAVLIGIAAMIEPELLVGMAIGGGLVLTSGLVWDLVSQVAGGMLHPG